MRDEYSTNILGVVVGALVVIVVLFLIGMGFGALTGLEKIPVGEVALSYGGGPIESNDFQGIHFGGEPLFENGMWDHLYAYPTTQRSYIISKNAEEGDLHGNDFVVAPTNDKIPVEWEVAVYFKLNTNEDVLRAFHERIGIKYRAWEQDGWNKMLQETFRPQIQLALQEETRQVQVTDVYSSADTLRAIQTNVGQVLKDNINQTLGGSYFCGVNFIQGADSCSDFTFVIKSVIIPRAVVAAFESNRTSEIAVQTKENEVKQAEFQAQAIEKLNAALSAQHSDEYVLLQAIKSGKITFWVIPNGTHLNLTRPGP